MRIIYDNLIDDLVATNMTALTTNAAYPVANMQDQRLSTRWRSTAATSQSLIFDAGGEPNFIGDAYTNLVADPTDLTTANWTNTNSTDAATALSINGNAFTRVINSGANAGFVYQAFTTSFTNLVLTGSVILRKGSSTGNTAQITILNSTGGVNIFALTPDFDNYGSVPAVATKGTLIDYTWIDAETLQLFFQCDALGNLTDDVQVKCLGSNNSIDAEYTYWTEVQLIDSDQMTMYPFVSGTHSADVIDQAFVMPDKFIFDMMIDPKFAYDTSEFKRVATWLIGANNFFRLQYDPSIDKLIIRYKDGTNNASMLSSQFDDGSSFLDINQRIRITGSIDTTSGTNTSRFIVITEDGNMAEDTTWSTTPDIKSSTFPTLSVGWDGTGSLRANSSYEYLRIYGGLLTETITSSDDVTDALAKKTAMLDLEYQGKFDFDTVALMGHNLSEGAQITFQANDYDAWEYTATGGSIIQSTMTWDADTILYFLTRTQKQYVKFSLSDPNNTGSYIEIGRPWIGQYLDISPSSLLDFKVSKKRSDTVIHGKDRHKWSVIGEGWRRFELSFPPTEEAMIESLATMFDAVGNHSSMIFCNFDTIRSYQLVEPCYVSIDGDFEFMHTRRMVWTWNLVLEEER